MAGISGYGLEIAIAIIAIMMAIGGIAIGLGFAFNNNKLKEFGKEELFQSVINGALVGGFVVLFLPSGLITSIVNAITLSNSTSISCQGFMSQNYAICFAYNYLSGSGYTLNGVYHGSINSQSINLMLGFLTVNTILGIVSGLSISLPIVSISFSSVIGPLLSQAQFFVKAFTTISISALVQSSLLIFIATSAITVILPAGLILRTFYPTRKVGGFLIAASIGLYVILPMSYVLNANIIGAYNTNVDNSTINQISSSASTVKGQILSSNSKTQTSFINSIIDTLGSIASMFSSIVNSVISLIAYFIVAAFILPSFSIVLTIISIKELSSILGAEVSFGLFDRV